MTPAEFALALAPGLAGWLAPVALHYRRGGWAAAGVIASAALLLLAGWSAVMAGESGPRRFVNLGWLALPALVPGLLMCAVAYRDRRPAALATTFALLALGGAALGGGSFAWIAFGVCAALAAVRMGLPPPATADERAGTAARNRTRRARSIVRKLVREGRFHWIPVYSVLRLSALGREGIERSGSYRFADHLYRNEAAGSGWLGRFIDRRLLDLPASRAFRRRYQRAQTALRAALESFPADRSPLHVLAVPCGIPRDLTELASTLRAENPALLARIHYHGMDIDPELLEIARAFASDCGVAHADFIRGDALRSADYPECGMHAVVSTGLGEFLPDGELLEFHRNVYAALRPGGSFYTSFTSRDPRSDAFLEAFELHAHYRTAGDVLKLTSRLPWSRVTPTPDETGLQTFLVAVK